MDVVRLNRDFWSGLLFVSLGFFGFWLARDLESGTASDMATGYFPRMMCGLLVALGGAISVVALLTGGDRTERWHWRPVGVITLTAVGFALLLPLLGFVLTIVATVLIASFAVARMRPLLVALVAVALVAANVGLFVFALGMPIQLWPSLF